MAWNTNTQSHGNLKGNHKSELYIREEIKRTNTDHTVKDTRQEIENAKCRNTTQRINGMVDVKFHEA